MIGAIVLAAGSSRRFGDDKRKARLANRKMVLQQSVENVLTCFETVLLVLRADDNAFAQHIQQLINDPKLRTFLAPDSALGMGYSLANAMEQTGGWDGVFVFLADMPYIRQDTIQLLKGALSDRESGQRIIVPVFESRRGHPVGFHAADFQALGSLSGDQGAKPVLQANQDRIYEVSVDDPGILQDVDTPSDLKPASPN